MHMQFSMVTCIRTVYINTIAYILVSFLLAVTILYIAGHGINLKLEVISLTENTFQG